MKKINWAILGAARITEKLIPAINKSKQGKLVAIASRRQNSAEECIKKYAPEHVNNIKSYTGFESILNDKEINVVYIPLSNEEHTETTLKAIRNKKHVLIEKPMAIKSKEVQLIINEAKENNVKIMEGFMYVFHPQFDRIQNIINSEILGEINYAHSMFSFPIQPARYYRINRAINDGGGALWDIGPYAIHTIRHCFKENPIRVYGQSKMNEHGADISTTGMIDFGSNKKATFDISFECVRRSEFEVFGQTGRLKCPLVWQPDNLPAKIIFSTEKSGLKEETVPTANHFDLEVDHFNSAIAQDKNLKLTNEDALWNSKTLEGIQKSILTNKWVTL
ncbi:Gfo/Idh/MocA family oxidoreductase [Methylophilaceae bacterium]|jgi:predicted dehydrogenase|nr:Gfo/Idh/MocA family oxidoreductase [Methylophilaceae bacterium]|tara:strand:- start:1531 stop:2535 length:1005 start_codon:yes stop_codon:yes gene_type:complete